MVLDKVDELEVLKSLLKKTFGNIKTDISINTKDLERLHDYNRRLEMQLMQLTGEIAILRSQLKPVFDSQNLPNIESNSSNLNFVKLEQKLADIEKKLDTQVSKAQLEAQNVGHNQIQNPFQQLVQNVPRMANKGLAAQIMRKVGRNKKSLIKKRIVEIASKEQLSLSELKEIVVDEQNLCSKATFYRYFDALKQKNVLSVVIADEVEIILANNIIEANI